MIEILDEVENKKIIFYINDSSSEEDRLISYLYNYIIFNLILINKDYTKESLNRVFDHIELLNVDYFSNGVFNFIQKKQNVFPNTREALIHLRSKLFELRNVDLIKSIKNDSEEWKKIQEVSVEILKMLNVNYDYSSIEDYAERYIDPFFP